jgi:NTE family protein
MTTAFALSGGGSLGAVQVGMLHTLAKHGVRADVVVGASVGALNGVYYAARPQLRGIDELAGLWLQVSRHDVFPLNLDDVRQAVLGNLPWHPLRGGRALANYAFPLQPLALGSAALGRRNYLFPTTSFEEFLSRVLPIQRLEEAAVPVEVVAAEASSGRTVALSRGPAVPALLASAAIPGLYPTIEVDGLTLMDGALADRTTLERAIALGADDVYVLTSGCSCGLREPPRTPVAMALHAYNLIEEQRLRVAVAKVGAGTRLHVIPPLCPVDVSPVDFGQTGQLIRRAAKATAYWLDHGAAMPGETRDLGDLHATDTAGRDTRRRAG